LLAWRPPSGMGIRLDSGVTEGQEITAYYDSMLAKLVAWGTDRQASIGRMLRALESFPVLGVTTNLPFLIRAISHPEFQSGDYDTGFIGKYQELTSPPESASLSGAAAQIAERFWQSSGPVSGKGRGSATLQDMPGPWQGLPKSTFP